MYVSDAFTNGITVSAPQSKCVASDQTAFQESPHWADKVADRMAVLFRLQQGWDGHNGRPVNRTTASYAIHVMARIIKFGVPAPSIVPGSYGGIQIEWHCKGWDIEIEVVAPNKIFALARDVATGIEEDIQVETDLNPLQGFVSRIAG